MSFGSKYRIHQLWLIIDDPGWGVDNDFGTSWFKIFCRTIPNIRTLWTLRQCPRRYGEVEATCPWSSPLKKKTKRRRDMKRRGWCRRGWMRPAGASSAAADSAGWVGWKGSDDEELSCCCYYWNSWVAKAGLGYDRLANGNGRRRWRAGKSVAGKGVDGYMDTGIGTEDCRSGCGR